MLNACDSDIRYRLRDKGGWALSFIVVCRSEVKPWVLEASTRVFVLFKKYDAKRRAQMVPDTFLHPFSGI